MPKASNTLIITDELVMDKIYLIRGQKVMIDKNLAGLYGVTTGNLNLAVKRNKKRFPDDFIFQLTKEEYELLTLQSAISKKPGRGWHPQTSICFYRAGCVYAIWHIKQRNCNTGAYTNNKSIC